MLASLLGIAGNEVSKVTMMGNVPHGQVYNQDRVTSPMDIDTGCFAPKAFMQIECETFGNQNSPLVNQDIVIQGGFEGVAFNPTNNNNLVNDNGVVIINPVIDGKTSNALLYQGYAVMDGDL